MNCCSHCFKDKEIIGFILSNSTEKGTCDFCLSKDVDIINCRELEELFQPVISVFETLDKLGIKLPEEKSLVQKMQDVWNIFQISDIRVAQKLLSSIVVASFLPDSPILNAPVEIKVLSDPSPNLHEQKWENLAYEVKYKNRFFLKETIDLELLAELLENREKHYDRGKIFYRARVSGKTGFALQEMGKPPADKSTSGRANPIGIPYLYLATKIETALHESRSSYLDYISIAELKLLDRLSVVSLREIVSISPFRFGDQLEHYLAHQKYLIRLEEELSKPVRRFDKELDYLPSQYLCEFVKSLGYDAIEYGSSLYNGGINIAVFNDEKLEVQTVKVFEISSVDLTFHEVVS